MDLLNYSFKRVENCIMCDAPIKDSKIFGQRLNCSQGYNPKNKLGISVTVMKCRNCNLIFCNPRPIPSDIGDHYDVNPETYWKEKYFEIDENYFTAEIEKAKTLLNFKPGMKALDIGGGIGKAHIALSKGGFDCTSIEPSNAFRKLAMTRYDIAAEKFLQYSIEDANLPEQHFDFITFGAVLEHLHDPSDSIIKAMSWLKDEGVIQIEVPSSAYLISKLSNLYFKTKRTTHVTNLSPMHEPFHLYEFGLKSFQKHALKNNYHVVHFEYLVCSIYNIPKILHPFLSLIMDKTDTGMQLSIWLKKN